MATPGRVTRSARASSTIDAQSTISSPDPLNTSFDSVAQPSARVTRSAARAFSSTAKSVPARSSSPRKQTFALDVGSTKKPSRLFVTVEAEGSEILEGNNGEDFKDAKRVLFPTPTPKRKRADTTTTSVPLRDEDAPAARTPGRRGRPRRQQTPMKQVPAARKRAKLSADADEAAATTPAVKATPGRKRKAPFVPEETITWASPSPPKRLRETPSPSLDDEAPAGGSPASSGFFNEPAEDTVAQEDFSPIFAHSLGSLRASLREQETQEIGEATSLIIEGALEELRQSRGEVVESTEQDDELLEDVKEPEVTNHHGDEQREEVEQPEQIDLIEEVEQPEEVEQIEKIDHTQQIDQSEHVDQPQSIDQPDQAEPVESVDHTEQIDHTEEVDRTEQIDHAKQTDHAEQINHSEQIDQTEQIEQTEQEDQPQHIDQPDDSPEPAAHFNEHDDSPEPVDHSDEVELPEQIIQPDESTGETDEAEETSAPRSFGLNYADFSSSVATKRRSSPRAPVSPFRDDDGSDYEDSFSEIPQEILDAAAPRGNWPGEARLRGSPTPVLAPPRAPSVDLGTRPSLSPIVRAGRALQSVTSDDASPRSHKNHLGSPFKPAAASTPAQKPGQAPEQQTEDRPQSAASKKSWISDIIEAGVNWFSPTRATSHASADSLSVGQDAGDASPSLPPTRPAPTEASVFKPQSRVAARKARQATVEDEDEEEDIWALEALRDSNFQVRPIPQQQSSKTTAKTETNNRPSFFQSYTGPSRKQSIGSKLGSESKPTSGSKLGSEGKRTFANRSSASKRSMAGSSWKPSTIPMSSDPAAPLESELSEYSLIAGGKQLASAKRSATQQGNEGSAKRRKDMSDFFSSPALLPGAENAQSALERKRLELAPKAAVKSNPQEWSLPTTTFFPTDRPFVKPAVDSPAPAAPALIPALVPQTRETPKPSPQEFDTAERKRAIRQARFAFRRALSETREEHNTSGAQGDLPPFGVDLTRVQFPQAFKFPRDIDTDVIMTREEVSKWAQETSNVESSSPIRHQPNKHASPTKSCLRPSTKPRTPGPRLQWGSDVLSPSGKLLKLAEEQLKQNFITDFKGAMYNERLHAQFGQSKEQFQAILANKENEKEKDFIPLPATPTRDVDMMDVDSFVVPANRNMEAVISISSTKAPSTIIEHNTVVDQNDSVSPASISTVESAETLEAPAPKWGYDDWCYLEDLFQLRKKGPFPFDFPDNFEPRSRHLVGLTMTSHGEKMRVNPWHISIIDGFQANTGRKWSDQEIARRVMSLAIVDLLRKEKREPKKPYRHTRKAAHRTQATST
ncbi:hypothetical protein B0T11DRAFT_325553 [Plectosphaerella cucumerina]|uniref:Uncharacterized protein n=1 Tax=Plectosphaerella cucumerina TaxID=40658 RepID=A0A8K0TPQ8_9PEZI|nr:hypothetical protein B0T11DRAFT_325553 [Plectosphaerella cucumerina]